MAQSSGKDFHRSGVGISGVQSDGHLSEVAATVDAVLSANILGGGAGEFPGSNVCKVVTDALRELVVVDSGADDGDVGTHERVLGERGDGRSGSARDVAVNGEAEGLGIVVRSSVDSVRDDFGAGAGLDLVLHVVEEVGDFVVFDGGVAHGVSHNFDQLGEVLGLGSGLKVEVLAVDDRVHAGADLVEFALDAERAAVVGRAEGEVLQEQGGAGRREGGVAGADSDTDVERGEGGARVFRDEGQAVDGLVLSDGGGGDVHGDQLRGSGELLVQSVLVGAGAKERGQDAHLPACLRLDGRAHGAIGGDFAQHRVGNACRQ
mmetsp:Transcript_46912/g.69397  ORF Transcript_46912/g.69397 Transcript_46912/m.69397 type:complete len:319 (+) Transcript_46912:551-1507(+)